MLIPIADNHDYLFYGNNLDILRQRIPDASVDLCYIDPPFNSKRTYFQIYNNIGKEDRAQSQAFVDTWVWGAESEQGLQEILANEQGRFSAQAVALIQGLYGVLGASALMAYLVHMALRVTEIFRVLKPTGSFYLHCDPTASHYLKLILDAVFVSQGGEFQNEIVWHYTGGGRSKTYFSRKHDIMLWYSKTAHACFNLDAVRQPYKVTSGYAQNGITAKSGKHYMPHPLGTPVDDVWDIPIINPMAKERLGYPTQKPEALLERIIKASTNEGDTVLDAYCGCGTTVAVAQKLHRRWIGIDITFQAVSLIIKRLEDSSPVEQRAALHHRVVIHGIPQDVAAAAALAHDPQDKLRKEFEKWAILTYSGNRATIAEKKGADSGVDGRAYFMVGPQQNAKVLFQAKSGHATRATVATLRGDMAREHAELGVLLTLDEPTKPMQHEAASAGIYQHPLFDHQEPRIRIVTVREIIEKRARMALPMTQAVVKAAQVANAPVDQLSWL